MKLGSFLQCLVHLFLGHDGCFKNFLEPYHEELSGKAWSMWQHHIPQNIFLNLGLADSRILHFWQVLESLHKFVIELHVLQCLFVRRSNKKQRRGNIISNFTSYLYQPSDIALWSPFSHSSKKGLSFPFSLDKKRIKSGNSTERRVHILIYFENWQGAPCSHRPGR